MTTTTKTWANIDAGPRMCKAVTAAIRKIIWEGKTSVELTGVVGQPESYNEWATTDMFGAPRLEASVALDAIGERYGWQVTAANYKQLVADCEAAAADLVTSRPVRDNRRTPEQEAERLAFVEERELAHRAATETKTAIRDALMAQKPAGAKAVIVAELREDDSDPMTDYCNNVTARRVAIGWRFSSREDFRALRAAAASFPETAHLGSVEALGAWAQEHGVDGAGLELEHRDNYSMGAGNYLSDHGWDGSGSGWVVKSYPVDGNWWSVEEIHLPPSSPDAPAPVAAGGVTVRSSSIGRDGVVEVVFAAKPSEEVRSGLKSHGFRWAKTSGCWYGRDVAYAESLLPDSV